MPTYAFACNECKHEFDARTSYAQKQSVRCPSCGSATLRELIGRYRLATLTDSRSESVAATGGCACGVPEGG